MMLHRVTRRLTKLLLQTPAGRVAFRAINRKRPPFTCPICSYHGPFADVYLPFGRVRHGLCPGCRSNSRHRLLHLGLNEIARTRDLSRDRLLYVAPEPHLLPRVRQLFKACTTADLNRKDVDLRLDLTHMDLPDASYDGIIAAHVLEHIRDDDAALSHLRRVLRPNGFALLPVPVVVARTVEYPAANPYEEWHVRAPGPDYFERYRKHFPRVTVLDSTHFPEAHQTYVYEDRTRWPTRRAPWRTAMAGERHLDYLPICSASS